MKLSPLPRTEQKKKIESLFFLFLFLLCILAGMSLDLRMRDSFPVVSPLQFATSIPAFVFSNHYYFCLNSFSSFLPSFQSLTTIYSFHSFFPHFSFYLAFSFLIKIIFRSFFHVCFLHLFCNISRRIDFRSLSSVSDESCLPTAKQCTKKQKHFIRNKKKKSAKLAKSILQRMQLHRFNECSS